MDRRLAAIVAIDVVDYSLRLSLDERSALDCVRRLRAEVIEPLREETRGRTLRLAGDGALLEFTSTVNAVRFAIETQRRLAEIAAQDSASLRLRIGIAQGDVVHDQEDFHGEGVNIAVRLEALAVPGGLLVSGHVFTNVRNVFGDEFRPLGLRHLRNIGTPIDVYQWKGSPAAADAEGRRIDLNGRQVLDAAVVDLLLRLHMRSSRLALSEAFDAVLGLPDEGRSLELPDLYTQLGDRLNAARALYQALGVELADDYREQVSARWARTLPMSQFFAAVFDNSRTAFAMRLVPDILAILRSHETMLRRRERFMMLVETFMEAEMLPQCRAMLKTAFIQP